MHKATSDLPGKPYEFIRDDVLRHPKVRIKVYGASGEEVETDNLFDERTFSRALGSDCDDFGEFDIFFEFDIPEFIDKGDDRSKIIFDKTVFHV